LLIIFEWLVEEGKNIGASRQTIRAFQTTVEKNRAEIRVLVGKYGFEQEFPNENNELFKRIREYCESGRFLISSSSKNLEGKPVDGRSL